MSKLKAVAYYAGIPARNSNMEKPQILDNFLAGVRACGDIAVPHKGTTLIDADVALVQGFVHEHGKKAPHLQVRRNAIEHQAKNHKHSLIVDSNLFLYKDAGNKKRYLRYSFDGVFPKTGFYFDSHVDDNRWEQIKTDLGIDLKPRRSNGEHILICLQRNGGWSMRGTDVIAWMNSTIQEIRKYEQNRPIIVRAHPGDKKIRNFLKIQHKNVKLSNNRDITTDLNNAWATVVFNSSPGVASAIEGVPVIITDPIPGHSQAESIANMGIQHISTPILPDREAWVRKLAMCHWNFEELKNGSAWQFFRQHIT